MRVCHCTLPIYNGNGFCKGCPNNTDEYEEKVFWYNKNISDTKTILDDLIKNSDEPTNEDWIRALNKRGCKC